MTGTASGFELGPITLHYFSLLIIAGLVAGAALAYIRTRKAGQDPEYLVDFLTWGIAFSLILARVFYIWNPPPSVVSFYDRAWYLSHPLDLQTGAIAIWSGGLGYAGALLGAILGILFVIWRYHLDASEWLHILVPGLLLMLTITPWGNFLIRQIVGKPTSLPWGVIVDQWPAGFDQPGAFPEGSTGFHPLPAYLGLWALVCLASFFLVQRFHLRRFDDVRPALPMLVYLLGLFFFDFLRVDVNRGVLDLTAVQWVSLILTAAVGIKPAVRNRFVSQKPPGTVASALPDD